MKAGSTITVIDIGSAKVCCCIASVLKDGGFIVIGVGYCACTGVRAGVIIDMESVGKSITKAVETAEKAANFSVKSVYVNVSGKNIKSKIVEVTASMARKVITDEDIANLLGFDSEIKHDEIIHAIPITFSVDSLHGIKDPVGMLANRLSISVNVVTAPKEQLNNILMCLEGCHLTPIGMIASSYASGICEYDNSEISVNQIIVDLGAEITSISFFYNGILCGAEMLSIGSKSITKDIAYILNITLVNAERVKVLHGAAFVSIEDERDMIFIPVMEDDNVIDLQQIPKSTLNQVIQARVEEILNSVKKTKDESIFGDDFKQSTVILTGGGSKLTGIKDFSHEILNKKVQIRQKHTSDFRDKSSVQIGNDFSVAIGMIKIANLEDTKLTKKKSSPFDKNLGFLEKTLFWLENNL
jgi:cell division protein FtsA